MLKRSCKKKEVNKLRFLVIKGRILYPGSGDLKYSIFDYVEFDASKDINKQQRKYVWRKFYDVDNKNPRGFKQNVCPRQRHIVLHDERVLTTMTIYDYAIGNIFYGFIPLDEIK